MIQVTSSIYWYASDVFWSRKMSAFLGLNLWIIAIDNWTFFYNRTILFQPTKINADGCPLFKKDSACPVLAKGSGCPVKDKAAGCPLFGKDVEACSYLKKTTGCPFLSGVSVPLTTATIVIVAFYAIITLIFPACQRLTCWQRANLHRVFWKPELLRRRF